MNVFAHSLLIDGSFSVNHRELLRSSGTMEDMFRACYKELAMDYPKFHKMDAPSKLAMLVTEPLLQCARQEGADLENRMGLLGVSHCGSTVTDQEHWAIRTGTGLASPAVFVYTLPNIGLGEITIRHRIFGSSLCLLDHEPKHRTGTALDPRAARARSNGMDRLPVVLFQPFILVFGTPSEIRQNHTASE